MENSKIEYFTQNMEDITLESLKKRLIKSCVDYNQTSSNFQFEYEIADGYIFCLLICDIDSECFPKMYRMLTVNAYNPGSDLYKDGNVGSHYTLEDVKTQTINYLSHNLNKIKLALNK